jgi:hypothetical protein
LLGQGGPQGCQPFSNDLSLTVPGKRKLAAIVLLNLKFVDHSLRFAHGLSLKKNFEFSQIIFL